MNRFLPSPLLSLTVLLLWLLLVGDFSSGQFILALLLAALLPLGAGLLQPERARIRRLPAVLRLAGRVGLDIVVSSAHVAWLILGRESRIRPAFVWVPLDIRDPHGITALASIISLTPGTLSTELSEDHRHLLVHCFDLDAPESTIATIKSRYESLLREIFE
ncbi:Na+/H+ antiporter subunit E [Lysobacter pythonis]|uniref:Na+/H+ antiporter subunit E n=1 Tax=Solilutibacter pythonis TaxID=2483112 RepID=A0A3M2I535_9GAMM|nr:Na+/H+ antiporter subunit E [Lysobacter pythonis]RMH93374.1 Na+/H+ antiporter subunit E [Lysobacter pythonis]